MSDVQVHPTAIVDPGAEIRAGSVVGPYCVIGPNVVIGENAIIGAGSVVTKDVPANAIVAGNPAKLRRYLNEEQPVDHGQ